LNYAKTLFFFQATVCNEIKTLALISTYSLPDIQLLHKSCNTIWACRYQGLQALRVINISDIHAVVAMAPLPHNDTLFFAAEKLGLNVAALGGIEEDL